MRSREMETMDQGDVATGLTLVEARAVDDDARLVMAWRNDPVTRAASFHQAEKVWPAFREEFAGYFGDALPPLFGVRGDGERIGFVRFRACADPEGRGRNAVDISINVAPGARGQGTGRRLIEAATARALSSMEVQVEVVLAEIRPGNAASVKAFVGAGYRRVADGAHDVDGTMVPVERYVVARESWGG